MRILDIAVAVLLMCGACSSQVGSGDSETHWIKCATSAECHGGQVCEARHCVTPERDAGGGKPSVPNPTGDCLPDGNGSRPGYSYTTDQWLPDCQLKLRREYFRVFAQSATSAYMLPRPDGHYLLGLVCRDTSHELRPLVDRYELCSPADSEAKVDLVNSMLPADALKLSHYLHEKLAFVAARAGTAYSGIAPYAPPGDILEVCADHASTISNELAALCATLEDEIRTGSEVAHDYANVAQDLAPLLNDLYGIECAPGLTPGKACAMPGLAVGCSWDIYTCVTPCQTSAECATAIEGSTCFDGACGAYAVQ